MDKRIIVKKIVSYALTIFVVGIIIFPVYWMVKGSLQPSNEFCTYSPNIGLKSLDFSGYIVNFQEKSVFKWMANSALVVMSAIILNVICSVLAAYSLAKFHFKLKNLILLLILSTQMIPGPLLVTPLYRIFKFVHIIDTFWCLILADVALTLPLSVWILQGFFKLLPKELEDASLVDGCTRFGFFYRIAVPLSTPYIVTISILTFFDTWNEYLFAYTFISDQRKWLASPGVASFIGEFLVRWQSMFAASALFTIPAVTIYLLLSKYIVKGVMMGAVKG